MRVAREITTYARLEEELSMRQCRLCNTHALFSRRHYPCASFDIGLRMRESQELSMHAHVL